MRIVTTEAKPLALLQRGMEWLNEMRLKILKSLKT